MTLTLLLLILGVTESVYMDPCSGRGCRSVSHKSTLYFTQLYDEAFINSSVAPWHLKPVPVDGREPQVIREAKCGLCTVEGLVAKAIYVQIHVHHKQQNKSNTFGWCRCPFKVAVGCTCVKT